MRKFGFVILVLVFCLIWSSAFIAGRVAINDFDPATTLVLRFLVSAALLLPFCWANRQGVLDKSYIRQGFLLGILNNVIYLGLTFSALEYISAGWVVIVVSCSPFMTAALAAAFKLEWLNAPKLAGILIGFCGVLVLTGLTEIERRSVIGLVMALAGTLAFSLGTVLFRGKAEAVPLPQLNFWLSVSGAVFLLPLSLLVGRVPAAPSLPSVIAILYLAFISMTAMAIWFVLIRMRGAATASSYHLLNPLLGVLLSWLILDTDLRPQDFAGAALIGLGLFVSNCGAKLFAHFLSDKNKVSAS